jgi:hypothetical protein
MISIYDRAMELQTLHVGNMCHVNMSVGNK